MNKPRRKVDRSWSFGYVAWVDDHATAEEAARSAAAAALKRTHENGCIPVQIEVTVRFAPKGQ